MRTISQSALMLAMAFMTVTFMGCKEDDPPPTNLAGFSPTNGPKGTIVTLSGISFGSDPSKIKVFFNGEESINVAVVSDTEITAKVPAGAFTGKVSLEISNIPAIAIVSTEDFTYELSGAVVSDLAGNGLSGFKEGTGENAEFPSSYNLASNAEGDFFVVGGKIGDVRKVTQEGVVTIFQSPGELINAPWGVAVDQATGDVYIGNRNIGLIVKIPAAGGDAVAYAGNHIKAYVNGKALDGASVNRPYGMVVDKDGNLIFGDCNNRVIRKVTPAGDVTTIAGAAPTNGDPAKSGYVDGKASDAQFAYPAGIDIDVEGNIYVADQVNHAIRKITPAGDVTTLAGGEQGYADGLGTAAKFDTPWNLALADDGNLYVRDNDNFVIRKVTLDGVVTTFAGTGTDGFDNGDALTEATFFRGFSAGITTVGFDIFVTGGNKVRKIEQN